VLRRAALPGASLAAFMSTPFLSVWAPGHGEDVLPKGTGISLPKGSVVIEQVHYTCWWATSRSRTDRAEPVLMSTPLYQCNRNT